MHGSVVDSCILENYIFYISVEMLISATICMRQTHIVSISFMEDDLGTLNVFACSSNCNRHLGLTY